eukprot:scpid105674/ scgid5382/ 
MADSADAENPGESVGSICKYVREEVEKRMNGGKAFDQFEPRECARFLSTDSEARISTFKIKVRVKICNFFCTVGHISPCAVLNKRGTMHICLDAQLDVIKYNVCVCLKYFHAHVCRVLGHFASPCSFAFSLSLWLTVSVSCLSALLFLCISVLLSACLSV